MAQLDSASWTFADDTGPGTNGTPLNATKFAALKASIEAILHNATYPTETLITIINEMVAARGNKANLDARLDGVVDADGNPIPAAGQATTSQLANQQGARNFWPDSLFYLWPDGDSSAPAGWTLSGTGAAVARTTGVLTAAGMHPKLNRGTSDAKLTKTLLASMPASLKTRKITIGVKCLASQAAQASIICDDGAVQTRGGSAGNGTYHSGDGTTKWLYLTHTISSSATKIDLVLESAKTGDVYFGMGVFYVAEVATVDWSPEQWGVFVVAQAQRGNATAGNQINESRTPMPGWIGPGLVLLETRLRCKTAPTTQAIIVRPAKGTATYPYTTQPQIAASATSGTARPDGTYANRCFKADGVDFLTWDITQVGSGTPGDEVQAEFVFLAPLDQLKLLAV